MRSALTNEVAARIPAEAQNTSKFVVRITGDSDEGCEWHQTFLSRTLGADVHASPCTDRPAHCCRYLVLEVSEG